jgi:hypothetical protein
MAKPKKTDLWVIMVDTGRNEFTPCDKEVYHSEDMAKFALSQLLEKVTASFRFRIQRYTPDGKPSGVTSIVA